MSNTSKRNTNKAWYIGIGLVIALVLIAFFVSRSSTKIDSDAIAQIPVNQPSAHLKGNLDSNLTLVEYSDFQCPACKAAAPDIAKLVEEFGDKFKLEYRHFPLRSIHPNAQIGAQAAEAAGMQGKFWEMHDMLFDKQSEWSQSFNPEKYFKQYAEELGINTDRFVYDLNSDVVKDVVNKQFSEAESLKLPGTPSFVVDGKIVDINEFVNTELIGTLPLVAAEGTTETPTETTATE
jgi:protein-disulfide isomerase